MLASTPRWLTPAMLCAWVCAAPAQTPPSAATSASASARARAAKADPLDARAAVPALAYESALSRYRRAGVDKHLDQPQPWRESNDTAARIGGWRAYAREAQQPDAAPAAPASSPAPAKPEPKPMPHGHHGHKMP